MISISDWLAILAAGTLKCYVADVLCFVSRTRSIAEMSRVKNISSCPFIFGVFYVNLSIENNTYNRHASRIYQQYSQLNCHICFKCSLVNCGWRTQWNVTPNSHIARARNNTMSRHNILFNKTLVILSGVPLLNAPSSTVRRRQGPTCVPRRSTYGAVAPRPRKFRNSLCLLSGVYSLNYCLLFHLPS